ncbi:hypothetical protein D3C85_1575470 [compost metagenome]
MREIQQASRIDAPHRIATGSQIALDRQRGVIGRPHAGENDAVIGRQVQLSQRYRQLISQLVIQRGNLIVNIEFIRTGRKRHQETPRSMCVFFNAICTISCSQCTHTTTNPKDTPDTAEKIHVNGY